MELSFPFVIPLAVYARWWFISLALLLIIAGIWAWVSQRDKRLSERQELEKNQIRTQFERLRDQVNPHFLFNSFNTLSSLIEEDPLKAQDYVERLSGFYRHILTYRNDELIELDEELRILRDYLAIQQARYEEQLKVDIELSPALRRKRLPPMTLQMLVENALKHNVISQRYPMKLSIRDSGPDELEVFNDRRARSQAAEGTGLGLDNLSRKLQLLGMRSLSIEEGEDFFRVRVPLFTAGEKTSLP